VCTNQKKKGGKGGSERNKRRLKNHRGKKSLRAVGTVHKKKEKNFKRKRLKERALGNDCWRGRKETSSGCVLRERKLKKEEEKKKDTANRDYLLLGKNSSTGTHSVRSICPVQKKKGNRPRKKSLDKKKKDREEEGAGKIGRYILWYERVANWAE